MYVAAVATGTLSVILTTSSIVTALTGIGVIIGGPLAGVSALFGTLSAACTAMRKQFSRKVTKHESTVTLAQSKLNSIASLVSKALADGKISDQEFTVVISESDKYHVMKASMRQKSKNPNLEKGSEREKIKRELKLEVRKKLGSLAELS